MLEVQREKEREKITIGFLTDIPPVELSEEDIKEFRRQALIETMTTRLFPVLGGIDSLIILPGKIHDNPEMQGL